MTPNEPESAVSAPVSEGTDAAWEAFEDAVAEKMSTGWYNNVEQTQWLFETHRPLIEAALSQAMDDRLTLAIRAEYGAAELLDELAARATEDPA